MTTENSNLKTVTLTAEQYAKALYCSHFLCNLFDLIDDSGLNLSSHTFTPLATIVALDLRNILREVDNRQNPAEQL